MSVSAALSFAQTVLSYFSPTKSPYYSVIAFGTGSLIFTEQIVEHNWIIIFIPIIFLLLYSTLLSLFDKPNFGNKEYDDQIKFSRAFSLSVAVLCIVYTGTQIEPSSGESGELTNSWEFWLAYSACLIQLCLFGFYAYVYANLKAKPINKNFVQLALITSTYLIGFVYAISSGGEHYLQISISLYVFWLITILVWVNHLMKSIKITVQKPADSIMVRPKARLQ